MTTGLPHGIICPIAVPLTDDERLDVPALNRLLDRLVPDLDGLFVLGTSGELALLRPEVAEHVVEAVVERAAGKVDVYVGIGDTGTARTIDNLRRARRAGVDYVFACGPYYYPVADGEALYRHFASIADASERPLLLYNIPQNTASHLTPATVRRLAEHPNVVGMKDSWGDMIQFGDFLSCRGDGFAVMQGREQLAAASYLAGADGLVSGLANLAPALLRRLQDAARAGDVEGAQAAQREANALARVFEQGYWLSALKTALAELGIGSGRAAAPIPPTSAAQREAIRGILRQAGMLAEATRPLL